MNLCSRPRLLGIGALLLLGLAALTASPISAAQPLGAETLAQDLDQTIACRKLLLEDPVLGPLNLGVRVKDRVAILWGPVPSPLVSRRAEQCLRTMIELVDVRDQTYVEDHFDWRAPSENPAVPLFLPDQLPPMLPDRIRPPVAPRLQFNEPSELVRLIETLLLNR